MDVIVSVVACVVLFLPLLIVALIVWVDTKASPLFCQQRMGKGGKAFTIFKFRTMREEAPSDMAARDFSDSDLYITKFGAFLRRSSIDELPQLLNILLGDMSFVGYRPVCLSETELNQLRMDYGVFNARPGITGLAQVNGRDNLEFREKAKLDAEYVAKCSMKMDLWCLLQTVKTVITGE
ncbi:MAG: sugar transferase, partial [Oscillospiraceae bacterium]|nr:sugar transferase [Oscillospiraceae bacterium]